MHAHRLQRGGRPHTHPPDRGQSRRDVWRPGNQSERARQPDRDSPNQREINQGTHSLHIGRFDATVLFGHIVKGSAQKWMHGAPSHSEMINPSFSNDRPIDQNQLKLIDQLRSIDLFIPALNRTNRPKEVGQSFSARPRKSDELNMNRLRRVGNGSRLN